MQQYFVEQAFTYYEAERKAREKYGDRLTILLQETVKIPSGFLNLFPREGVKIVGIIPKFGRGGQNLDVSPRSLIEASSPRDAGLPRDAALPRDAGPHKEALDFNQEKEKILAMANAGKENTAQKEMMSELNNIKEKLENLGLNGSREEHLTLNRIDDLLILNDFPLSYRKSMLERAKKEFTLDTLNDYNTVQDKILEWIGESISIYEDNKFKIRPRIMILVGPTGVGKTTTVAKLAANFGVVDRKQKRRVALITIDCFRIGAKQQLETYSSIMGYPCYAVGDYEELKKTIDLNTEECDLIIVDTIGKNPRDMVQLGEMKQLLDACGSMTEVHLVLAAATKSSDLKDILRHFESFNYRSVIITKLDETIRSGNIVGALAESSKPVSYITNGQKVPTDIMRASVVQFLINLEGFKVNRIKLEEKFPEKGLDQMQQWR